MQLHRSVYDQLKAHSSALGNDERLNLFMIIGSRQRVGFAELVEQASSSQARTAGNLAWLIRSALIESAPQGKFALSKGGRQLLKLATVNRDLG